MPCVSNQLGSTRQRAFWGVVKHPIDQEEKEEHERIEEIGTNLGFSLQRRIISGSTHGTGVVDLDKDLSLSRGGYGDLLDLGIGLSGQRSGRQ
jgi:hypothetical protein